MRALLLALLILTGCAERPPPFVSSGDAGLDREIARLDALLNDGAPEIAHAAAQRQWERENPIVNIYVYRGRR